MKSHHKLIQKYAANLRSNEPGLNLTSLASLEYISLTATTKLTTKTVCTCKRYFVSYNLEEKITEIKKNVRVRVYVYVINIAQIYRKSIRDQ